MLLVFFSFLPFSSFFSFAFQDSSLGILAKIPFNSSFLNILFPSTTNMHMCTWARKTKRASSLMWLKLWFSYTLAPPYGSTLVTALNCSTYIVQYICFHIFWKHQNTCFLDFFYAPEHNFGWGLQCQSLKDGMSHNKVLNLSHNSHLVTFKKILT